MKRKNHFFLILLFLFIACKNNEQDKPGKTESDIDAAREFIRAALNGKFEEARLYMLNDSANVQYMDVAERTYLRSNNETKSGYLRSSINIHKVEPVNDSTTIVIYSNSFKNDHDTIKVIRQAGKWLVDLKYLYEHPVDTTLKPLNP